MATEPCAIYCKNSISYMAIILRLADPASRLTLYNGLDFLMKPFCV